MLGIKEDKNKINYNKLKTQDFELSFVINKLVEYLCIHIKNQIEAGAEVVQIFDSWAGLLPAEDLSNYCYKPNFKIVEFCKNNKIPTICFPKGIGVKYKKFNNTVKPDGINLDSEINPLWAKQNLNNVILQGGLDPKILLLSDDVIKNNAIKYLSVFKDIPYIFNLGHGLLPQTDPDKVDKLVKFYREYKQ